MTRSAIFAIGALLRDERSRGTELRFTRSNHRAPAHPSESRVRPSVRRTRAIGTLWRRPAQWRRVAARHRRVERENDCGDWRVRRGRARPWIHRIVRDFGDERDVLQRREAGNEIVELEDEADVMPPIARKRGLVQETDRTPAELWSRSSARRGLRRMLRACSSRLPDGPSRTISSPGNAMSSVERVHLDIAHAVDLLALHLRARPRMAPS